jgi:hypothetical protein
VKTRLHAEALEQRLVPTVQYFGGNVLPQVQAQALYLGSEWSAIASDAALTPTLDAFLKDLTGGSYMDALTRAGYGVGRGSASAGVLDNVAIPAGATISDAAIQARLEADIRSGKLQGTNADRLYVVYVEPNVAVSLAPGVTTTGGILGYHNAFAAIDPTGSLTVIRYAVVAFPGGTVGNSRPPGTAPLDQLTAVSSHEVAEGVTDPDGNFSQPGWFDPQTGQEIADITENNPKALVRLDGFLVQEAANRNEQLLTVLNSNVLTATHTTLRGVVDPNAFFPTVTFTVTISTASGTIAPNGSVILEVGDQLLASSTVHVVNGVATATFTVEFMETGAFTFTAAYSGTAQFVGSFSNTVTVEVS